MAPSPTSALRNLLLPGTEGGITLHVPSGETLSIFDAAMKYKAAGTPLIILAGKETAPAPRATGRPRAPWLLGVKAVIAESFERIHRSNLIGMGVLPLQFVPGQNAQSLGLTGKESYAIAGGSDPTRKLVSVTATPDDGGKPVTFEARVRIDTPKERDYFRHGGILHYVLRQLAVAGKAA